MAAVNTRRLPNAMNFLRQLEILKKTGDVDNFEVPRNKLLICCCDYQSSILKLQARDITHTWMCHATSLMPQCHRIGTMPLKWHVPSSLARKKHKR